MLIGVYMGLPESSRACIDQLRPGLPADVEFVMAEDQDRMPSAGEVEVSIGYWLTTEAEAPKLRWIHWPNAGVEDAPAHYLAGRQWQLTHGSGPAAVPIAEWTLASMLFFAHRFRKILQFEAERTWWSTSRPAAFSGRVLRGSTVGIVGYGAVGRQVARLCKAFDMQVHASVQPPGIKQYPTYRTPGTGDPEGSIPDQWYACDDLEDVLPAWDYVVLCLRVTDATRYIINARTLRRFKPTAILINPARGELIDETALVGALQAGLLGGAALDVFETEPLPADHPLRDAPNVLISPHCSPETPFYQGEIVAAMRENLHRFLAGKPLLNAVSGSD